MSERQSLPPLAPLPDFLIEPPRSVLAGTAQPAGGQTHEHRSLDFRELMTQGIPEGARHNTLVAYAGKQRGLDRSKDEVHREALDLGTRCGLPPDEVDGIVDWVYAQPQNARFRFHAVDSRDLGVSLVGTAPTQPGDDRYRLYRFEELKDIKPPAWQVEGLLYQQALACIFGPPAVFKSFLALDLALSVASETRFYGRPTTQGVVIYCLGEGFRGLLHRILAWSLHHKVPVPTKWIRFMNECPQLLDETSMEIFLGQVDAFVEREGVSPSLFIIDTLARATVGMDENKQQDMGVVVHVAGEIQKRWECGVVAIHHANKGGQMRGSTVWRGALDTNIEIKRDGDVITVSCDKQKDAEEFRPFALTPRTVALWDEGLGVTSIVLEPVEPTATTQMLSGRKQQLLNVFRQHSAGKPMQQADLVRLAEENGLKRQSVYRWIKELIDAGQFLTDGERRLLWLPGTSVSQHGVRQSNPSQPQPWEDPDAETPTETPVETSKQPDLF